MSEGKQFKPYQQDLSEEVIAMVLPHWEERESDRGGRAIWLRDPKNKQVAAWQLVLQKVRSWEDYNPHGMRENLSPLWSTLEWKSEKHMYESLAARPEEDRKRLDTLKSDMDRAVAKAREVIERQKQEPSKVEKASVSLQTSIGGEVPVSLERDKLTLDRVEVLSDGDRVFFDRPPYGATELPEDIYWIRPLPLLQMNGQRSLAIKSQQRYKVAGNFAIRGVYQVAYRGISMVKCLTHRSPGEYDNITIPGFTILPKIYCAGLACGSHGKHPKKMFFLAQAIEGMILIPFMFIMNRRKRDEDKIPVLDEYEKMVKVQTGTYLSIDWGRSTSLLVETNHLVISRFIPHLPEGWKTPRERMNSLFGKLFSFDFFHPPIETIKYVFRGSYSAVIELDGTTSSYGYKIASMFGVPYFSFDDIGTQRLSGCPGKVLFVMWDVLQYHKRSLIELDLKTKGFAEFTILIRMFHNSPLTPGFFHYVLWAGVSCNRIPSSAREIDVPTHDEVRRAFGHKLWRSYESSPFTIVMTTEYNGEESETESDDQT